MEGASLLTRVLTARRLGCAVIWGLRGFHGLGEDVGGSGLGGADHVGVDAEGDRRVRVAQAGRDDMHRHAGEQQGRGVDMPQIVQPGVG